MRPVTPRAARLAAAILFGGALVASAVACSPSPGAPVSPGGTASASPTADPAAQAAAQAAALVKDLTDADLVGQVLMPSINLSDPGASAAALMTKYRLGGVILMGNVENTSATATATQVRALTDAIRQAARGVGNAASGKVEPITATDQEYGWVTRIKTGLVQLPSAMTFGAAGRPELTTAAWQGAGAELAAVGINVDFAPDADVLGSAGNLVIGSRSFGSDPAIVSAQVAAAVQGLQAAGVAATLKHFPGHGHTTVNSHDALPVLTQSRSALDTGDLPPFRAGIQAGTWLVMSGHLDVQAIDPGIPASFSHKVLVDLLRGQLGFTGVLVTDALNMEPPMRWAPGEAAVRAMLAGNDLLLMPPDLAAAQKGLLDALASGRLPRERLVEAVTRILTLKFRLATFHRPDVSTLDSQAHRDAALAVAAAGVTVLKGACDGPLVSGPVRVTSSAGRGQQAAWLAEALRQRGLTVVSTGGQVVHLVGYGDGSADLAAGAAVTVAMDTPFLLRSATSGVRLAAYSSTQAAMQAVAAVLAGAAKATGRSPVAVAGLPSSACAG